MMGVMDRIGHPYIIEPVSVCITNVSLNVIIYSDHI